MSAEPVRTGNSDLGASRWLPYVQARLSEMAEGVRTVGADESISPDPAALRRALPELTSLLDERTPAPSVVPTVDGGVQFVWHKAGWDIEIEVLATATLAWVRRRGQGPGTVGPVAEMRDPLVGALRHLVSVS